MKKISSLILLILFLQTTSFLGQNLRKDSLLLVLKKYTNIQDKTTVLFQLAELDKTNNPAITVNYLNEIIDLNKETNNEFVIAKAKNSLGFIYQRFGEYDTSIEYFLEALEFAQQEKDSVRIGITYNNIGNVYYYTANYSKAQEYFEKVIKIKEVQNNSELMFMVQYNLANLYSQIGEQEKAIEMHRQNAINGVIDNDKVGLLNLSIGKIFHRKEMLQEAKGYYLKANESFISINDNYHIAFTYSFLGSVHLTLKDADSAFFYLNKSLEIATKYDYKVIIKDVSFDLYRLNNEENNYKNASVYLLQHTEVKEQLFNLNTETKIAELEAKFLFKKEVLQNLNLWK